MRRTKKIVFLSLMCAFAIVLHIVEATLPNPMLALSPGAKLGLSNIITLSCLYLFSFKETFVVVILRILIGSMLAGTPITLMYAVGGGVLSLLAMYFAKRGNFLSFKGVSILGALAHNCGQLLVATFMLSSGRIFYFLPIMLISSLGTGYFVALASGLLVKIMNKHMGIWKKKS